MFIFILLKKLLAHIMRLPLFLAMFLKDVFSYTSTAVSTSYFANLGYIYGLLSSAEEKLLVWYILHINCVAVTNN